jgi:hypothetical protein
MVAPQDPYMPVLSDKVQTRSALGFATNHPPGGWNIGKRWPQAVLPLDRDETAVIGLVLIGSPDHQVERSKIQSKLYVSPIASERVSQIPDVAYQDFPRTASTPRAYSQCQYARNVK